MKAIFKHNVTVSETLISGDNYLYTGIGAKYIRGTGMPLSTK